MSEVADSASVVVELVQDSPSFLKQSIDLKRLLKDVSRQSKPAVDALVGLLSSKDEKVRLAAAKSLLDLQVSVAKEVNQDQIQRLIAEFKLNSANGKSLVPLEEDDRPMVDFTTIREVK